MKKLIVITIYLALMIGVLILAANAQTLTIADPNQKDADIWIKIKSTETIPETQSISYTTIADIKAQIARKEAELSALNAKVSAKQGEIDTFEFLLNNYGNGKDNSKYQR